MNYLAHVKFIFNDGTEKELDSNSLMSFVCSENLTDANVSVKPGLCEQYADITFYDRDNQFHLKAMNNGLDDAQVVVKLKNLTNNTVIELGTYVVNKWDIEGDNSIITAHCKDLSFLLDYIVIPESDIEDRNIQDLLDIVFDSLPGLTYAFFDNDTRDRCNSIVVPKSWNKQTSLSDMLNNICYVGMLRMFYKDNVFYVARSI